MKILLKPNYKESEIVRFKYFTDDIKSLMKPNKKYKLLDVGCSQLEFVNMKGIIQSYGIDYKKSKEYDEKHFKLCNLNEEKISFPNNSFDFIIAGEILEHLKRPFELIEEISRVAKRGAIIYISTPTPHYYLEILKDILNINKLDDEEHLNLFSRIHLISYCKSYNLELINYKYYKFWIPFINLMILHVGMPKLLGYQIIYKFKKI